MLTPTFRAAQLRHGLKLCPNRAGACPNRRARRPAVAAVEFAIACPIFFLLFLAMVEFGRAMMTAGVVANAARVGARAGAVTGGDYNDVINAANRALSDAGMPTTGAVTVMVNGATVVDTESFAAQAVPGATVSVKVSLSYASVSWLPGGAALFLPANQNIGATCSMTKEG